MTDNCIQPAQWLWRPSEDILGSQLMVRVGGSFTWPPPHLNPQQIERLVLVAGGVGIKYVSAHLLTTFDAKTNDQPTRIDLLATH